MRPKVHAALRQWCQCATKQELQDAKLRFLEEGQTAAAAIVDDQLRYRKTEAARLQNPLYR